ncbi:MAG: DUF493 domain-containing protein [Pseudomonadota bacterium]
MGDDETLLEFPCAFSVKAMGESASDFASLVEGLVAEHVEEPAELSVRTRPSRAGKFTSVTVTFSATSKAQLDAIYRSLSAHKRIKMAL